MHDIEWEIRLQWHCCCHL